MMFSSLALPIIQVPWTRLNWGQLQLIKANPDPQRMDIGAEILAMRARRLFTGKNFN